MLAARTWLVSSLPLAAMHRALREALKIGTQSIVSIVFWVVDFSPLCFVFLNFIFVVFAPVTSDLKAFLAKCCKRSSFPLSPQNIDNSVKLRGDHWHRTCCTLGKEYVGPGEG